MLNISFNKIKEGQFLLIGTRNRGRRYFEIAKALKNRKIQILSDQADIKHEREIPNAFKLLDYVYITKLEREDNNNDVLTFDVIEEKIIKEMADKLLKEKIKEAERCKKELSGFKKTMKKASLL
ncbi:MAG: hypothetical protein WC872_00735 [Candidatus Absconditabacterales bacterium]|jgi:hypothetical protein